MCLIALKSLDLLVELVPLRRRSVLRLFHSLSVLTLQLLDHRRVGCLSVRLVIKVHLLLKLERLLELLLELLQISLGLITLRLQELEATFPEGSLLIEQVALLLQLSRRVVQLSPQLLVAVRVRDLALLELLGKLIVSLPKVMDLTLVVRDELLTLLFQVRKLLLEDGLFGLSSRCESDEALFDLLKLSTLGLVLGLGGFLLLEQALRAILQLSLHLLLIDLNPIFVPLHRALVLSLHLGGFSLCKLDLLLHQGTVLFEVDVLVVELVLSLIELVLNLIVLFTDFDSFELVLLLLLVQRLFFLHHDAPL